MGCWWQESCHHLRPCSPVAFFPEDPDPTGARTGEEILRQTCRLRCPEEDLAQAHSQDQAPQQAEATTQPYFDSHDSILEDLVFPAEIVGKRIRVRLDASKLIKVHLDKNQQTNIEHKVDTFAAIYKRLT